MTTWRFRNLRFEGSFDHGKIYFLKAWTYVLRILSPGMEWKCILLETFGFGMMGFWEH